MSMACLFREMSVETRYKTVQKNGIMQCTIKYYDNRNSSTASKKQCPTMCLLVFCKINLKAIRKSLVHVYERALH